MLESVFVFRQKPTQLSPINTASPYLWAQWSRLFLRTETESSLRNDVRVKQKNQDDG
jgi:hypothetical protein